MTVRFRTTILGACTLLLAAGALTLDAQRFGRRRQPVAEPVKVPYDGRYTFARIRFEQDDGGWDIKWAHDYPTAERNFMQILSSVSTLRPYMDGGTVLTLDDPDIFRHPVLYLCEPGFWRPTDEEVAALRSYLNKGGFIVFDDFFGRHWYNFEEQMRRVLPGSRIMPVPPSHPVFDSFFRITDEDYARQRGSGFGGASPQYLGIFEDDDPNGRLMVMIFYDNDIGEYMEYSDQGFVPVDVSNTAYKFGVNYLVYALTH
ncbi:MAG TPA: DUF4159 domain-containing protein [Gemmatimonadales bacterium]